MDKNKKKLNPSALKRLIKYILSRHKFAITVVVISVLFSSVLNMSSSIFLENIIDQVIMGLYDIPMISHIPGLTYLAPTSGDELFKILDWSTKQKVSPVIIRFPVKEYSENVIYDKTDYTKTNINKVLNFGNDIALFGVGDFFYIAEEVYKELKQEGYNPTLINPLFLTGLDTSLLDKLCLNHKVVVTIEDGIKEGGYGQTIASYLGNTMKNIAN